MIQRVPDKVSFSGRMANTMTRVAPGVAKWFSRRQAATYEKSAGKSAATLNGKPTFRLTVVGRKSGEPRSVMLMLVRRGEDLLVCGSQAGASDAPNWWKTLVATGHAPVQVGPDTFETDARVLTEETERAEGMAAAHRGLPRLRVLPIAHRAGTADRSAHPELTGLHHARTSDAGRPAPGRPPIR
jgi:deazaflavin-dependent oxidoreductase (nitroreductase family)